MTHDTEAVMAYVDGELDPVQRAEFEAALTADRQLQEAVRREQGLRKALQAAYDPVLEEPVPAALQAALATPAKAKVVDFAAAQVKRDAARPGRRWNWPEWTAMAACVVVGVLLGVHGLAHLGRDTGLEDTLVVDASGNLWAQGRLAHALTDALASEAAATDAVTVGLSFKARDGRYCRSFALAGARTTAGLACRGSDQWEVLAIAPAPTSAPPAASAPDTYRTATTALPPGLLQTLDSLRAGDVLDAAGERAARERGWRP